MATKMRRATVAPLLGLLIAVAALVAIPSAASADFSVTPTPNGLTITTYSGSLGEFASDGNALNLVSAFATVQGSFVGYVFGAPAFVNAAFTTHFAGGLNNQGLIVRAGASQRTGNAQIDAVIDAVLGGNAATVAGLVEFQVVPCTTAQGAGGPPKCEGGDANGTPYTVLPLATCEGEWIRQQNIQTRLAGILAEIDGLYAVVESSTDNLPADWPEGDHYIVFHRTTGGQDAGVRFHVDDGKIVMIWQGCLSSVQDLTTRTGGGQLPMVIGPFGS